MRQEAVVVIQLRSDMEEMRGVKKEPDSGFTLKVQLRKSVDGFGMRYDRDDERGQDNVKAFGFGSGKDGVTDYSDVSQAVK